MFVQGIKGGVMAGRTVFAHSQRIQALEMLRRQEEWDAFKFFVARWRELAARATEQGKPAPDILPHPEDIEFADDLTVNVLGPMDAEELKPYLTLADFRDLFFAMFVYGIVEAAAAKTTARIRSILGHSPA